MIEAPVEIVAPVVVVADQSADLDLVTLLIRLWHRRWLAPVFIVAAFVLAIIYLHAARYEYLAELTVTPAEQSGPSISGNLANLGSLVGLDLGPQATSGFNIFGYAVRSYPVAERLSHDPKIMHRVFADDWDGTRWRQPASSLRPIVDTVKTLVGVPIRPWQPPTAIDLYDYIEREVSVQDDKKKSLLTISYQNVDPGFARYLLQTAVDAADSLLRTKSLARSTTYVRYLEARLNQVQIAEYRQSLAQALIGYENTRMMASSNASFAAEQFGDVWVSNRPVKPRPLIVFGFATAAALIAWGIFALMLPKDTGSDGSRQRAPAA